MNVQKVIDYFIEHEGKYLDDSFETNEYSITIR